MFKYTMNLNLMQTSLAFIKGGLTLSPRETLAWPRMRYEDSQGEYVG